MSRNDQLQKARREIVENRKLIIPEINKTAKVFHNVQFCWDCEKVLKTSSEKKYGMCSDCAQYH